MEKLLSPDGTTIAYDRTGSGPAVVMVGGALNDRATNAPLAALLSRDFTVFNYDRRGRGASGDTPPYQVDREIEDLEAVLAAAGGSAHVFANCSGAILALEAAARRLPMTRLAMYEPPFIVDDTHEKIGPEYGRRLGELIAHGRRGEAVEHFMTNLVGFPPEAVAQIRSAPIWPSLEELAPSLIYDGVVLGDGAMPADRVAAVRIPGLVIDGGASPQWARNAVRAVAETMPHARRVTLEGHDHNLIADAVHPLVDAFFAA